MQPSSPSSNHFNMHVSLTCVSAALQAFSSAAPHPEGRLSTIRSADNDATLDPRQELPTFADVIQLNLTESDNPISDVPLDFSITHYNNLTCNKIRMENVRQTNGIPTTLSYGALKRDIQRFFAGNDQGSKDAFTDLLAQDWRDLLARNNMILSKFNFTDLANATEANVEESYDGSGGCAMQTDLNDLYECENSVTRHLLAGTPPAVDAAARRERLIVAGIITGTAAGVAALAGGMSYAQQLPGLEPHPRVVAVLVAIVAFISLTCISIANYLVSNRGRIAHDAALTIQVTANVMARMATEAQQAAREVVVPAAQTANNVATTVASSVTQGIQTSGRAVAGNIPRAIGAVSGASGSAVQGLRRFASASTPTELTEIKVCRD